MVQFRLFGTSIAIAKSKAQPFENQTIWNQTFKKSWFQMFPDFKWLDFRSPLCYLAYGNIRKMAKTCTWVEKLTNSHN